LGRGDAALDDWRMALSFFEELGDDVGVAQTLYDAVWETSWSAPGSAWLEGRSPLEAARALAERGLAQAGPQNVVARCRLLALLALWSARAGDRYETSSDLLDQAEAIGARLSHPEVAIELLEARAHVSFAYGLLTDAVGAGEHAVAMRLDRREQYHACDAMWLVMLSRFCLGQFDAAESLAARLDATARKTGHLPGQWNASAVATLIHLASGADLAESAARATRDVEEAARTNPAWRSASHLILGFAHFYGGRWTQAQDELDRAASLDVTSFLSGLSTSSALLVRAYGGDRDLLGPLRASAADLLRRPARNPAGVWDSLLNVVECLAQLRQTTEAGALYPIVCRGLDQGIVITYALRLWQTTAGIAAAAAGHWDAARHHFTTALNEASSTENRIAQAEVRRWYGQMLLVHPLASERAQARPQLSEALARYHALGMRRHVDLTSALLASVTQ
jgi:tetratricopeptide (TPR) repeat protein